MATLFIIVKAIMLVGFAFAAFFGLAMALGVNLLPDASVATCGAVAPQLCLFTIV